MIKRGRVSVIQALAAVDLPFERLVAALNPPRSLGSNPLVQISFNFLDMPPSKVKSSGRVEPFNWGGPRKAKVDLTGILQPAGEGLTLGLRFSLDRFTADTVQGFGLEFLQILENLVHNPLGRVALGTSMLRPNPNPPSAVVRETVVRPMERLLPEKGTQASLARIWRSILKTGAVYRSDDFFSLGGHSLLAFRMIHTLRAKFGVALTLRDVFLAPTLEGMAHHIDRFRRAPNGPLDPSRVSQHRDTSRLSYGQLRLWSLARPLRGQSGLQRHPVFQSEKAVGFSPAGNRLSNTCSQAV